MTFNTALNEAQKKIIEMDYNFLLSYYNYTKKLKIKRLYDFSYISFLKDKSGKKETVKKSIPIWSSNEDHAVERAGERAFLNEPELIKILDSAINQIRLSGNIEEGGYRIESRSKKIAIPFLLYKNLDTIGLNKRIYIKGTNNLTPFSFTEHPKFFGEVRTILTEGMYGFEYIKIYSNYEEIGVLRRNLQKDVFIESKESLIKLKLIIVD